MYGKSYIMSTESITEETVKISTDGKTTVPKQARRFLGVEKGDEVAFKITGEDEVVVEKSDGKQ